MVFRVVVCCVLLATAYGASLGTGDAYIAGGEEITIQDTPWQVSLQNLGQHFCGGVVITRRHFLTTCSCVEDEALVRNLLVRVGATRHNFGGVLKAVIQVNLHQDWNVPTLGNNDIAIGKFKYPIFYGINVQPIRLAAPGTQLEANQSLIVTGWATAEAGQSAEELPDNLQAAEFRHVPLSACIEAHGDDDEGIPLVNENNLCAVDVNENGNTACNGDTGSPIISLSPSGPVLQGIVSWHAGCGTDTPPGVFVRVSRYINWLREQIGRQQQQYNLIH